MRARWQGNYLWAVAMLVVSFGCHAQSTVTPEDEYKNQINIDQTIHPLGEHPFGESISLYDGTLSFEQTDVSVPGNGPTIHVGRVLLPAQGSSTLANIKRAFADWNLDIPRIETYTAAGWQTASSATLRCTDFSVPPTISPTQPGADPWSPDEWWYGYHLMIPGEGSQTLLQASTPKTVNGASFSILTKQNWVIGCGVTASDGGEGFLAIAPDGTQYTFAHLFYQGTTGLTTPLGTPPAAVVASGIHPMVAPDNILGRQDAQMYVTQIKDRFGNTLTYNYDTSTGYLDSITASDGREVDITYISGSSLVQSITAKAANVASRTWTYSYDTTTDPVRPILTGVQLPDGSAVVVSAKSLSRL